MNKFDQFGFGLAEVLCAILLFSMTIITLQHYQKSLIESLIFQHNRQQAQRIAFQLLESYPDITNSLPLNWQQQVILVEENKHCRLIEVTVWPDKGDLAIMRRWICF